MALTKLYGSTAIAKIDGVAADKLTKVQGGLAWTYYHPAVRFSSSDKNAGITLSNGDLTVTAGSGSSWQSVRASTSKSASGKYYFEVTVNTIGSSGSVMIGLCDSAMSLSVYPGNSTRSYGWWNTTSNQYYFSGSSVAAGAGYTTADVVMVAVDFGSSKIWFGKNSTWNGGGDPAAGTNPAFSTVGGVALFPAVAVFHSAAVTANFGDSSFSYTIPAGFTRF